MLAVLLLHCKYHNITHRIDTTAFNTSCFCYYCYKHCSSWTVPETMPMGHLHVLFELLRATRLFVVVGGQLRGVITRDRLYDALAATLSAKV
jgi:hypothetical protein